MSKIIVSSFVSLDGVMQAPGGPEEDTRFGFTKGGWVFQFWNEETGEYKDQELSASDGMLLGRVSYKIFEGAWPKLSDAEQVRMIDEAGGDTTGMDETGGENAFTDRMNSLPKYVASRTLKETPWNNSTLLKGDAAKAIADLKKQDLGNILVYGSGDLVQTLVKHNLVDEYHLMVFPIVLGGGLRLFRDEDAMARLQLVDAKPFKTGVVLLTYEPGKDGNDE